MECQEDYTYLITTICSISVLILSEILPFTSTEGNGILDIIVKRLKAI